MVDALSARFGQRPEEDGSRKVKRPDRSKPPQEDLPYNVELWDVDKKSVEQVLAPA